MYVSCNKHSRRAQQELGSRQNIIGKRRERDELSDVAGSTSHKRDGGVVWWPDDASK
jgi:hypothetical protein